MVIDKPQYTFNVQFSLPATLEGGPGLPDRGRRLQVDPGGHGGRGGHAHRGSNSREALPGGARVERHEAVGGVEGAVSDGIVGFLFFASRTSCLECII